MMEKLKSYIPTLRSPWWTGLLGLSLMANLVVGGAIIGRNFRHNALEDAVQNSLVQLVPRRFIEELPHQRRGELMSFLHQNRQDIRTLRQDFEGKALLLADALDAPSYDAASVKSIIENFTTGNQSLAARGASVVVELVEKLTPEERRQLAITIRARDKNKQK
jgi:uncharacterized membrane protein